MKKVQIAVIVLGLSVLAACPGKKKQADDGGAGAAAEAGAMAGPGGFVDKPIENEKEVTEYPQERDVNEVAVLLRDTKARKSPPNGPEIASLPANTTVKKLVQKESSFRIAFDDPTTGKRLCGWVPEDAFSPAPVATATATHTAHAAPKKDAGAASVATADAGGGSASTAMDAGGGAAAGGKDAGGGAALASADAGGGAAAGGSCPAGQRDVGAPGKPMCLKLCAKNGDCPDGNRCSASKFGKPAVCVSM